MVLVVVVVVVVLILAVMVAVEVVEVVVVAAVVVVAVKGSCRHETLITLYFNIVYLPIQLIQFIMVTCE